MGFYTSNLKNGKFFFGKFNFFYLKKFKLLKKKQDIYQKKLKKRPFWFLVNFTIIYVKNGKFT